MPTDQRDRERAMAALRDAPLDLPEMADALMPAFAAVREEARREALMEAAVECDAVAGLLLAETDNENATAAAGMCAARIRALAAKGGAR